MVTAIAFAFVAGMFTTKVIWAIRDSRRALPPASKRELKRCRTTSRLALPGDRVWRVR